MDTGFRKRSCANRAALPDARARPTDRDARTMPHAQIEERAVAILGRKAKGLLAYDEVLAELADADCASALAAVISERTHLRPELVQRALEADSDEAISVMCCAAGFKLNSYSALLRMRR